MRKEKALLIVNPAAGYNTGERIYKRVYGDLKGAFDRLDLKVSESPGKAVEIATEASDDGYELLIALGGDGTAFEVLNGIMKSEIKKKPAMSFIPSGSGNSFLKDFNINTHQEAVERIINGKRKKIDIIKYDFHNGGSKETAYFMNIMGIGFIARVAVMRLKYFRLFKSFGYTLGVLFQTIVLKPDRLKVLIDGKKEEITCNFVSISNSKYTGGNMMMAPGALLNDGKMDIIILKDAGRMKLLRSFPKIFKGTHVKMSEVADLQAKKIDIESDNPMNILVDGEVIGSTPLTAKVLPKALEVII